jgi:hypothetical protein
MPAGGRDSHFEGRRFALLMRDLDAPVGADPVAALRGWLEEARRGASRALAAKASCWCSRVVCAAGSCGRGAELEARCDARWTPKGLAMPSKWESTETKNPSPIVGPAAEIGRRVDAVTGVVISNRSSRKRCVQ